MSIPEITLPRQIRTMSEDEYAIVTDVLGEKLPARVRIWITDAYTESADSQRAIVLPTSMITTAFSAALGLPGIAVAYLSSVSNLGYLINVGPRRYSDLTASKELKRLLVHETTHVWQGANGLLANNFFAEAMWCHATKGDAAYDIDSPPKKKWADYNPEQQAIIVQSWFLEGQNESGPYWPYIRENFRTTRPKAMHCAEYEESMALQCKR